mgnify:CR=1 FL=1
MRKPLVALGLVVSTSLGVIPAADVLAATPVSSPHASTPRSSPSNQYPHSKSNAVSGAAIVQTAMQYLGYPYTATGDSPRTGFSCIGFVSFVYRSNGIALPGGLDGAYAYAPQVSFSGLMPGDVLYFQNTVWPGLSHAAIYIGGGKFIHAEWYNRGVVISSFTNDPHDGNYWIGKYLGANRPWNGAAVPSVPGVTPPAPPGAPISSSSTDVGTGPTAVVNVSSLNVRSTPSKSSAVVEVLPLGANVTILGKKHGWYHVRLADGNVGWVMGAFVSLGGLASSAPNGSNGNVGNPTAPARTGYPSTSQSKGTLYVRSNGLRVYAAPYSTATVLATVSRGMRLQILARSNGWIKIVLFDGTIGWIKAASAAGGTRTASQTGGASFSGGSKATVAVNVRSGPSLTSSIVTVLPVGGRYRITAWSHGWAHVQLASGLVGWISGTVIGGGSSTPSYQSYGYGHKKSTRAAPPSTRTPKSNRGRNVLTAGVRIHSQPGINAPVVGLAAAGTRVQVIGYSRGWVLVRTSSGLTGYVLGTYVK